MRMDDILCLCNERESAMPSDQTKKQLVEFMTQEQVFKSGSFIEQAKSLGVSKRTADAMIGELTERGLLIQMRRGIYATSEQQNRKAATLAKTAHLYQKGGMVALESALLTPSSSPQSIFLAAPAGARGTITTPLGAVGVVSLSKKITDRLESAFGTSGIYNLAMEDDFGRTQSPEMAAFHAVYLSENCGEKSPYNAAAFASQAKKSGINIDWGKAGDMFKEVNLSSKGLDRLMESMAEREARPTFEMSGPRP